MDTEKQEQQTTTEEQKVNAEEATSEVKTDVSTERAEASEGKPNDAEIEALIQKRAQSLKDKELKPLYERLQALEGRSDKEKRAKAAKEEEDLLFGISEDEIEQGRTEGVSEKKIRSLQEIEGNLRKQHRFLKANMDDFNDKYVPLVVQGVALQEFRSVWKEVEGDKPVDFALVSEFMDSVKDEKMNSTEVISNKAIRFILKNKTSGTTDEAKRKAPDNSAHTTIGRKKPQTPEEKVDEGLRLLREKQNRR